MRLFDVQRVLYIEQSRWLAGYFETNSTVRADAKSDIEKEFFQLLTNWIYGKTCENQMKLTDIKLLMRGEVEEACRKATLYGLQNLRSAVDCCRYGENKDAPQQSILHRAPRIAPVETGHVPFPL